MPEPRDPPEVGDRQQQRPGGDDERPAPPLAKRSLSRLRTRHRAKVIDRSARPARFRSAGACLVLQGDHFATFPPRMRLRPTAAALSLAATRRRDRRRRPRAAPPPATGRCRSGPRPSSASPRRRAVTERDAEYMKAGRDLDRPRCSSPGPRSNRSRRGPYNWTGLDEGVTIAARPGLEVLPFVWGTPRWVANKPTTMPVDSVAPAPRLDRIPHRRGRTLRAAGRILARTPEHRPRPGLRSRRSRGCRFAPGRSGTRPTSTTSPSRSRRPSTRSS